MVPIHDTDVAGERWSKAEWENYELWEKVEHRLKRRKHLWILATVVVFFALSAVPIVIDRWPKWTSRTLARQLAQEINRIKREASIDRAAYRIKFIESNHLNYVIERLPNCSAANGDVIRSNSLVFESSQNLYAWLPPESGKELGVPGLVSQFCYDYLTGNDSFKNGESIVGVGIVSVNDLSEKRLDRLTVLLLSGVSGEISFD